MSTIFTSSTSTTGLSLESDRGGQVFLNVTVNHKLSHCGHPFRVAAAKPVENVDIVGAFLEKESGRLSAVAMPIAVVSLAPVADEVPAPGGFHCADPALVDPGFHLPDHREVAHVVAEVKLRPRLR